MGISKAADYSILIVGYLSSIKPGTVKSKAEIAGSLSLPPDFISKLLQKLVKVNIIVSVKGVKGGYRLLKTPETITLREVVEAIDGEIHIVDCLKEDFKDCGRTSFCSPVIKKMVEVEHKIVEILDDVCFNELVVTRN